MESLVYVPAYEVFIILEPFRAEFTHHVDALRPLIEAAEEPLGPPPTSRPPSPQLLGADCYYRAETDVGLLALRFDKRTLTQTTLSWVLATAARAALPILDPSRLGEDDRRDFYDDYLPVYAHRVEDHKTVEEALQAMAFELEISLPTPIHDFLRRRGGNRAPTAEGSSPRRHPASGPWDGEDTARNDGPPVAATGSTSRPVVSPRDLPNAVTPDGRASHAPRGKSRASSPRAMTIPGSPNAKLRYAQPLAEAAPPLHVRFLRGDHWVPGRLRGLNMQGARVATGAPPRVGDDVQLALAFEDLGVVLRGAVGKAETGEDALASGFAGFEMRFGELVGEPRDQLRALLVRAKERGISLKPPPARAAIRFPLRWPVRVVAGGTKHALSALDISRRGMFVATNAAVSSIDITFQIPHDTGGRPIIGRARVVREVTEQMARERGLERGVGVEIVSIGPDDEERFEQFVQRVARRCEARILIGASRARADALAWDLAAVGYTVLSTTSADDVARAATDGRPPDLAILDDSLTENPRRAQELRRVFAGQRVPCIAVHGARPERTRAAVDLLLKVAN